VLRRGARAPGAAQPYGARSPRAPLAQGTPARPPPGLGAPWLRRPPLRTPPPRPRRLPRLRMCLGGRRSRVKQHPRTGRRGPEHGGGRTRLRLAAEVQGVSARLQPLLEPTRPRGEAGPPGPRSAGWALPLLRAAAAWTPARPRASSRAVRRVQYVCTSSRGGAGQYWAGGLMGRRGQRPNPRLLRVRGMEACFALRGGLLVSVPSGWALAPEHLGLGRPSELGLSSGSGLPLPT
jgi:hypothetical protein